MRAIHDKVILSLCERYDRSKTIKLSFSSWNKYLVPRKTLFREAIQNKDSFLSDFGPKVAEDVFERK